LAYEYDCDTKNQPIRLQEMRHNDARDNQLKGQSCSGTSFQGTEIIIMHFNLNGILYPGFNYFIEDPPINSLSPFLFYFILFYFLNEDIVSVLEPRL
jgi:hypothetical protein